jgi:hypothetical protein
MRVPIIQKIVLAEEAFVERRLPEAGKTKFLVKVGQDVKPYDFVAEAKANHRHRLTAGLPGKVAKILPGRAALLQTEAVIIRGVFGIGDDTEGEVRVASQFYEPIVASSLSASGEGAILIGGFLPSLEVIKKAEAVGVRGIVCGGANRLDLLRPSLPILLTEGFGPVPMSPTVFSFLSAVAGRHVFLSPEELELLVARYVDHHDDWQELFLSEAAGVEPWVEVKVGDAVQVFSFGQFGQLGKVTAIKGDEVEVEVASGKIYVPGRNVGIIK